MGTLKPKSNGPLYSNAVIGTLVVYWWAVTFGTASRGLGGLPPRPVPSSLYQMYPITVSLCDGPLLYGFNVAIKGLTRDTL